MVAKHEVVLKGKVARVDSLKICEARVIVTGSVLRMATIEGEWYDPIEDPVSVLRSIESSKLKADIFTFMQTLPHTQPQYHYYMEWDNVAAIPIKDFEDWFQKRITKRARTKLRRSQRLGVHTARVDFSDRLVEGIRSIYNESEIRQGRQFWHYGKDFETVKSDLSDRLDRAEFIGAYYNDDLIGFIKLLHAGVSARTCLFLTKIEHRDKATSNALLAKAVEICAEKKIAYLVYGQFVYGKKGSDTLSDFKRGNGFEKVDLPRYYVPLTMKGHIALKLGLHHGIIQILPRKTIVSLINLRKRWMENKTGKKVESDSEMV